MLRAIVGAVTDLDAALELARELEEVSRRAPPRVGICGDDLALLVGSTGDCAHAGV